MVIRTFIIPLCCSAMAILGVRWLWNSEFEKNVDLLSLIHHRMQCANSDAS